jgi:ABC-type Mn2+/Zn2+ transport system permease subunit
VVIAMVVDARRDRLPADRPLPALIAISVAICAVSSFVGAYISYFLDCAGPAASSCCLQTLIFLTAFVLAPQARPARRPAPGTQAGAYGRLMDTLLAPFTFPFMQQALAIAVLTAVPTALLSCFWC